MSQGNRRLSPLLFVLHSSTDGVGRPAGIVRIGYPLENAAAGVVDLGDRLAVYQDPPLTDRYARPRFLELRETPDLDLIADQMVIGPDLAAEGDLAATQRPARTERP